MNWLALPNNMLKQNKPKMAKIGGNKNENQKLKHYQFRGDQGKTHL